ncbi:NAD-dependent deacetylase [Helicobacter didelphidarum]|uniref:protein acetyllysine N-acetyltransferase n=1 Tax=Helicobacter didelphidarum TaxID=2040648 RepID=A0A3D8IQU5_9HELI|nr:Sir2 family NAD-dependent protein deacetylase [Helicobacter didelphidarum]RDU67658.1 NAD-dependent deacetylase [Helicobacter didelphidarum]
MDLKQGKIVIFSGAGISADSGLATFRDNDGLWSKYNVMEVCNYKNWRRNYKLVHEFYNLRRQELQTTKPNIAHEIVCKLTEEFEVINITQNVDDLLERAGCKDVIHLHGFLKELRCEECETIFEIGYEQYNFTPCPTCNATLLKPNIVFFFEHAPQYQKMYNIFDSVCENDIIIVIGTSGEVININSLVNKGYKILNNLESRDMIDESLFDSIYLESSTTALPKIYKEIKKIKSL